MIQTILNTTASITEVAANNGIYVSTLSKRLRQYLNIKTIDDVVKWCDVVDDTRKIISARSKSDAEIWEHIQTKTQFLPQTSTLRERLYYIKNNTTEAPTCKCGGKLGWNTTTQRAFNEFCSPNCPACISDSDTRRRQTNLLKRGVEYAYQDKNVKIKRDLTMIDRYGDTNYNRSKINDITRNILSNKEQMIELYEQYKSTFVVAEKLGVSQAYISKILDHLEIPTQDHSSSFENLIREYVQSLGVYCEKSRNIISPQELDIYIPSYNLAIECDGLYWHSQHYKEPLYHLHKTQQCETQGIRLIHIFEHEYLKSAEKIKSRLSSLLGFNTKIFARKCVVREITSQVGNDFFERTHIQGSCKSAFLTIGLFYNETLVACMSFSKARYTKKTSFELLRYCSELYTTVVGGPSKLFKYFVRKYNNASIVTYSDKRWNTGNMYKQLGFVLSHNSAPNYFYFNQEKGNYITYSRIQFQKHKLSKILKTFDPLLTEYQNMKLNKYERIWDCGNSVWVYNLPSQK